MSDVVFSDQFLEALGRWQRGWRQDPALRLPIATALEREVAVVPDHFRRHAGGPLYRKRHLYRKIDETELKPLFLEGELDEGSPTSWSGDLDFVKEFSSDFDLGNPGLVAAAIFRHTSQTGEVILNIPALWRDPAFVAAAEAYRLAGGAEAEALFNYHGDLDQQEVILRAPLRLHEIYGIIRPGNFQSLCALIGVQTREQEGALLDLLEAADVKLDRLDFLPHSTTQKLVQRVAARMCRRQTVRVAVRRPSKPVGRRGRLSDAHALGCIACAGGASFLGWRRLHVPGGFMEARWSDGTVAYHRRGGAFWICTPR